MEVRRGFHGGVLAVLVIQVHEDVAVHAVACQQDQNDEIWDEQCQIEAVHVIEAAERGVQKVLANVGRNPSGSGQSADRCCEISDQEMVERLRGLSRGPRKVTILPNSDGSALARRLPRVPRSATNGPAMRNTTQEEAGEAGTLAATWMRMRASLPWIVGTAFALRLCWIVIGHTYRLKTTDDNFSFGWEMGRIAASIASGHGFSNPFGPQTGPTAWEPPLYPYLVAGVFHLFGTYSMASAFVLLSLNSLFSALTCI